MGGFGTSGKIKLIPDEEDLNRDIDDGGYPVKVPSVYLEGTTSDSFPNFDSSWTDDSVVLKREDAVVKYTQYFYTELFAEDENGNKIWVDGRTAPYESDWGGRYLDKKRLGHSFTTTVYDLKTLTKRTIEYKPSEEEPMDEYEICKYADLSEPAIAENEKNIITAMQIDIEKYRELPDDLKNDVEFNIKLLDSAGSFDFIEHIPNSVKDNDEFIKLALLKSTENLSFFSDRVKDDYDIVLSIVKRNGCMLEFASERLKDNETVVKAAVTESGTAIEYASSRLNHNDEIIRLALLSDFNAYKFLPDDIKCKREYALFAVKYSSELLYFFKMLPECLQNDKELVIASLNHGGDYFDLPDEMKMDRDIAKRMASNRFYFSDMAEELRNDEEIARAAIESNPSSITAITDPKLRDKLVSEDPNLAFFVKYGQRNALPF